MLGNDVGDQLRIGSHPARQGACTGIVGARVSARISVEPPFVLVDLEIAHLIGHNEIPFPGKHHPPPQVDTAILGAHFGVIQVLGAEKLLDKCVVAAADGLADQRIHKQRWPFTIH